jgi:hypothetical protein
MKKSLLSVEQDSVPDKETKKFNKVIRKRKKRVKRLKRPKKVQKKEVKISWFRRLINWLWRKGK